METKRSELLKRVDAVLAHRLEEETFSTHDLARAVFLSRSQLYRQIKRQTGLSTSRYIRRYRLEQAEALLRDTGLSVTAIAWEVGFSWSSYFTRCFKEEFGRCPLLYRRHLDLTKA